MKIERILITPEKAKEYLSQNTNNRPVSEKHVKLLAAEMLAGKWAQNGDTIVFSEDRLIDGQHRLKAIVLSESPQEMLVVHGVAESTFATKDCGKRRSASDSLAIMNEKYTTCLASSAVFVFRYDCRQLGVARREISTSKVLDLVQEYGDGLRRSVEFCIKLGTRRLITPALMAALHFIFARIDSDEADNFWERLISGDSLMGDSPIFLLRERLVSNAASKAKLQQHYIAALCIISWNYKRDNRRIKSLRYTEQGNTAQEFPVAR